MSISLAAHDKFSKLPDEIFMIIFSFFTSHLHHILKLSEVSKEFKRIIGKSILHLVLPVKAILQAQCINLRDPLFSGFAEKITDWEAFNEQSCIKLYDQHLLAVLDPYKASIEKVDRLFGYMIENREFFAKILLKHNSSSLENDPQKDRILTFTKGVVDYISEMFASDVLTLKFIALLRKNPSPLPQPSDENVFLTISQYHQEIFPNVSYPGQVYSKDEYWRKIYAFLDCDLFLRLNLILRFAQTVLFMMLSFGLDLIIGFIISYRWHEFMYGEIQNPLYIFVIEFKAIILSSIISYFFPCTWPVFRVIDQFLHRNPPIKQFALDCLAVFDRIGDIYNEFMQPYRNARRQLFMSIFRFIVCVFKFIFRIGN